MHPPFMANGNVVDGAIKLRVPAVGEAIIEEASQTITASGDVTLTIGGAQATRMAANIILFDCNGANRNLTLPTETLWRGSRQIINISSGAFTVTVRNSVPATIAQIDQGEGGIVFCNGTTVHARGYTANAVSGNDFGVAGIKTDVVAESTATAGVTIDGLLVKDTTIDFNGTADCIILDADGDTTISSPTEDQIDIEINGADDFVFVANVFRALSGSVLETNTINETTGASGVTIDGLLIKDTTIDFNGTADCVILDDDGDTTISAPTANQIDFEIAGADDFTMTANSFNVLTGSGISLADSCVLNIGTGNDLQVTHNGTNTTFTSAVGRLIFDNTSLALPTVLRLGTDNSDTSLEVRNDSDVSMFTVYGSGLVTAGAGMWVGCPSEADPNPAVAHRIFDDFQTLDAAWTVTEDVGGMTQAAGNLQHGEVVLTNTVADDAAQQIQYAQETFRLTSGKKIWFEARLKVNGDATQSDFFIGLCELEDLTGVADNMPANGFGFRKDDGDTNIDACSSDNGVNLESLSVGTLVNNTMIRLGILFNGGASGAATLTPYINGVAGAAVAAVTYATMTEVSPIFMIRNGDGVVGQVMSVDYVKVVAER